MLTFVKFLVVVLAGGAVMVLVAGQLGLLAGPAPRKLGVENGRLKPPSTTPNSVSSQAGLYADHPMRAYAEIEPFRYSGDGKAALARLAEVVKATPRVTVVTEEPDYLYAQCRTALLKFTDDLEFWLDESAQVIHVRSSSRLGRKDFGVNRTRVEAIRQSFSAVAIANS